MKIIPPPWWAAIWPLSIAYWRGFVDAQFADFDPTEPHEWE